MLRLSAEAVRLDTNLATTSSSTNVYPATEVAGIERHAPTTAQSKNVVALRVQPRPLNRIAQAHAALGDFLHHVRRRWYLYPPLLLIWTLAYVRVFFEPTPRVPLLFNWTPSLPYHVALLRPLSEQVAELEQRAIAAALTATGGNKLAASRLLGVSRATLYSRMAQECEAGDEAERA